MRRFWNEYSVLPSSNNTIKAYTALKSWAVCVEEASMGGQKYFKGSVEQFSTPWTSNPKSVERMLTYRINSFMVNRRSKL